MVYGSFRRFIFRNIDFLSRQSRWYATNNLTGHAENFLVQKLSNRGLVEIKGNDSSSFLQGLITNDIGCISHGSPLIYSMVLNAKGRVLYDMLIYGQVNDNDSTYLLEAENSHLDELIKLFSMYKLRKKIKISRCDNELSVYSIFRTGETTFDPCQESKELIRLDCHENIIHFSSDPRIKGWSSRIIIKGDVPSSSLLDNVHWTTSDDEYTLSRYRLGIGEGFSDHPQSSCLPLECNVVFLNGVSFNKGCYIGQELTARSHHTGVVRKRLMPVTFDSDVASKFPQNSPLLNDDGQEVGRYRSGLKSVGLALVRLSNLNKESTLKIVCPKTSTESKLTVHTPFWWPDGVV